MNLRAAPHRARVHTCQADGGFTVVEAMNLLALVAFLAAIGMVGTARYIRHTSTAEAITCLGSIAKRAADLYDHSDFNQPAGSRPDSLKATRHFPPSSRVSVPANPKDVQGTRYQSSPSDWDVSPWKEMGFSIPQPQRYVYSFRSEGVGVTAKAVASARGDLDADDVWSSFELEVVPNADFTARVAPVLLKSTPEE